MDALKVFIWIIDKISQIPIELDKVYLIKAGTQYKGINVYAGITIWDLIIATILFAIAFYLLSKVLNGTSSHTEVTNDETKVKVSRRYIVRKDKK